MVRLTTLLVLLLLATFICYLDRSAFSYVILPIQQEFSFSSEEIGLIGSGFGIGYLLMVGISGFIVDRYGPFKVWAVSGVLWCLILLGTALADNFLTFFILRILLGVAESVHFPCVIKAVFTSFQPGFRTRSLAFIITAIPLSFILGGPFSSSSIDIFTWRGVFVALGIYSLAWAAISYILIPKKSSHDLLDMKEAKIELKKFFSSSTFIAICAMAFVFDFIGYFFLTWFPYYLETVFHIQIQGAGYLVTIPWFFALVLLVFGGWLSDYLFKRTKSFRVSRSYPMFAGYFLAALCFFLLLVFSTPTLQILLFSFALGFVFLTAAPLFLLNMDLFPEHCSAAVGIFISFGALAEFLSPALIGLFRHETGSFNSSLFLTGVISLIGALICLLFVKPKNIVRV